MADETSEQEELLLAADAPTPQTPPPAPIVLRHDLNWLLAYLINPARVDDVALTVKKYLAFARPGSTTHDAFNIVYFVERLADDGDFDANVTPDGVSFQRVSFRGHRWDLQFQHTASGWALVLPWNYPSAQPGLPAVEAPFIGAPPSTSFTLFGTTFQGVDGRIILNGETLTLEDIASIVADNLKPPDESETAAFGVSKLASTVAALYPAWTWTITGVDYLATGNVKHVIRDLASFFTWTLGITFGTDALTGAGLTSFLHRTL